MENLRAQIKSRELGYTARDEHGRTLQRMERGIREGHGSQADMNAAMDKTREAQVKTLEDLRKSKYTYADEVNKASSDLTDIKIRQGEYEPGDFWRGMREQFTYKEADFYSDLDQIGRSSVGRFKDGVSEAFITALDGTKKLSAAFSDLFKEIGDMITEMIIKMAVKHFIFAPMGLAKGGEVKGYNRGGFVTGGSGFKDDVPAMLNKGEYVLTKKATQKYGLNFLNELNTNGVRGMASGGLSSKQPIIKETEYTGFNQIQDWTADPQAGLKSSIGRSRTGAKVNLRNAFVY